MFWFTCHAVGDDPIVSGVLIWIQGEWCIMSDKMLQEVMTSPGCIEFHSVDVPVPAEGQVLVRIHQIGVFMCIMVNILLLNIQLLRGMKYLRR